MLLPPLGQGDVLGHYVLTEKVGAGSTSEVWAACDARSGARVALKVFRSGTVHELLAEAAVLRRLDHPHIVRLLDVVTGERPALVLDLAGREDLQNRLDREGTLSPRSAVRAVSAVLAALAHVHGAGLVHGDVKAANVVGGRRLLLADFGAGTGLSAGGTPESVAPELVGGAAPTAAGDVYACGVLLYALLAGRTPYAGGSDTQRVLQRQLRAHVPPVPGVAAPLWSVLLSLLAKVPSQRPTAAQARGLLRDLPRLRLGRRLAVQGAPVGWEPAGWVPVDGPDPRRTPVRGLDDTVLRTSAVVGTPAFAGGWASDTNLLSGTPPVAVGALDLPAWQRSTLTYGNPAETAA